MLPRGTLMNDKLPVDRQIIEVRLGSRDEWQPAIYRDGEFVDAYGITLDRRRISGWRPANSNAVNRA